MPLVPASVRFYFDLRETAQAAHAQLPRSVRTALTPVLGVSVPAQWAALRAPRGARGPARHRASYDARRPCWHLTAGYPVEQAARQRLHPHERAEAPGR
jgi:hypothetical protein